MHFKEKYLFSNENMEQQLFIYKNLVINFYYSNKSIKKNIVDIKNLCLFFPGLPNFINKEFFETRISKNTAFFSVYYYGTWLSGGKFTIANCRKSVKTAIEFVKNKGGIKTYDKKEIAWNFQNLYVLGYSFAGNPILKTNINRKDVKAVLLYSPQIYLDKKEVKTILGREKATNFFKFNKSHLQFLQRTHFRVLRGITNISWFRYFCGEDSSSRISISSQYPKIVIYHGLKDEMVNPAFSKYFHKTYKNISRLFLIKKMGHDKELFKLNHLQR